MGKNSRELPELLGLLYDGLLWPDRWNAFLAEIAKNFGSDTGLISFHDSANHRPTAAYSIGYPSGVLEDWIRYYGRRNPRVPEMVSGVSQTGAWVSATSLDEVPESYRGSEYAFWLQRVDLYHSLLAAVPYESGIAALSFARGKSARPFPQTGQKLMSRLVPHLQRVLEIHNRMETLHGLIDAETIALDSLDAAILVVDEQGNVIVANERAERLLQKGEAIALRHRRLAAVDSSESYRLERLVRSADLTRHGAEDNYGGGMTIHRDNGLEPLSVIVAPLSSNGDFAGRRCRALVFFCDPTAKPGSRTRVLRNLFGLTPAECRLAALLHSGLDLRVAAEHMRVTIETARFMLKNIFRKTSCHRQAQLIRLLNRLPGEV